MGGSVASKPGAAGAGGGLVERGRRNGGQANGGGKQETSRHETSRHGELPRDSGVTIHAYHRSARVARKFVESRAFTPVYCRFTACSQRADECRSSRP